MADKTISLVKKTNYYHSSNLVSISNSIKSTDEYNMHDHDIMG